MRFKKISLIIIVLLILSGCSKTNAHFNENATYRLDVANPSGFHVYPKLYFKEFTKSYYLTYDVDKTDTGTYEISGDMLTLNSVYDNKKFVFRIIDENHLRFIERKSSSFDYSSDHFFEIVDNSDFYNEETKLYTIDDFDVDAYNKAALDEYDEYECLVSYNRYYFEIKNGEVILNGTNNYMIAFILDNNKLVKYVKANFQEDGGYTFGGMIYSESATVDLTDIIDNNLKVAIVCCEDYDSSCSFDFILTENLNAYIIRTYKTYNFKFPTIEQLNEMSKYITFLTFEK